VLLALGLAACGGGDSAAEPAEPSAPRSEPEPAAELEPEPAEVAAATPSGKTIVVTPSYEDELRVSTSQWSTDFTRHTVPLGDILGGGPGKEGIPAIDDPSFVSVDEADALLEPSEPVIEVVLDGVARAYPLRVLIWHEIVNDVLGQTPVTVTFCPLCNAAIAFDRRHGDRVLDFGTTGNLRNSDLVMYDRQTETWWQQFGGEGIVGELAGEQLTQVPAAIVAWQDFAKRHPDGSVLSQDTGFSRPYGANPYVGYDTIDQPPFFPVENLDDDRLPPKERVVLLDRPGETIVVPFSTLELAGAIEVEVAGEPLTVEWVTGVRSALNDQSIVDAEDRGSARVTNAAGELVAFDTPFWFSVAAFRPNAEIVGSP
jgi:hypothetical protein